jgi:hypothetical protein
MIPRFGAFLIVMSLMGCALELLSPLQRLQTSQNGDGFSFSWPVDVSLPLGAVTLSLDDPSVTHAIFGDLPLVPGDDERMGVVPFGRDLDPVTVGENLQLDDPLEVVFPPQGFDGGNLALPNFNVAPLSLSAAAILGHELIPGLLFPSAIAVSYDTKLPLAPPASDFSEARLGDPAGKVVFTLRNHLGVTFTPVISLLAIRNGVSQVIGRSSAIPPMATGTQRQITLPLYPGATLTRDLELGMQIWVSGGQTVQAPTDGLAVSDFDFVDLDLTHVRMPLATQSFALSQQIPLDLPDASIASSSVRTVRVESGALKLVLSNGLPVANTLDLRFTSMFRPGQTEPLRSVIVLGPRESRTQSITLDGVTIRPIDGRITIEGSAVTSDTGPGGALFAVDGSQKLEGAFTLLAPLRFSEIQAPLTRTVTIATSSTSLNLPEAVTRYGLKLNDVALRLRIENRSALSGAIQLDVTALMASGEQRPLTDKQGKPLSLPILPAQTQDLQVDAGNSNLLDLLNAMPTDLMTGGRVVIDSKGEPVTITRGDRLGGRFTLEIPLSVTFAPMGPGLAAPAYDVKPATPIALSESDRTRLASVERVELNVKVDNGWRAPFDLDLRFSEQGDPYADGDALVKALSLGNAERGFTVANRVVLEGEDLERFRKAQTLGFRLRSPGSSVPVTLFRGSRFSLSVGLEFKATVDSRQMGQ